MPLLGDLSRNCREEVVIEKHREDFIINFIDNAVFNEIILEQLNILRHYSQRIKLSFPNQYYTVEAPNSIAALVRAG